MDHFLISHKYILPLTLAEKMNEKTIESIKEKREYGFNLYIGKDNIIFDDDHTKGNEKNVDIANPKPGYNYIGTFHTHIDKYKGLSPGDMLRFYETKEMLSFIGSHESISYFQLKSKYINGLGFDKIRKKLEKLEEIDKKLGSVKELIDEHDNSLREGEIQSINNMVSMFNKTVQKLTEEKNKIQKKYFKETIIGQSKLN